MNLRSTEPEASTLIITSPMRLPDPMPHNSSKENTYGSKQLKKSLKIPKR